MRKRINLDLQKIDETVIVFKALSSPVRLRMLHILVEKSFNISDLAERLSLPMSTAALHVRILEKAGLIFLQEKPGLRGAQKLCAALPEDVYMNIYPPQKKGTAPARKIIFNMPLGNYFDCQVTKPCGIAGKNTYIGIEDTANAFYSLNRVHAQLVWFNAGFLEYRFPSNIIKDEKVLDINFSFEACSEAAGYNNDWPSDITVWINHEEVFTFHSAGDFGDRRGIYTPAWWSDGNSQYGELHFLEINDHGCFGDHRKTSDFNLETLRVSEAEFISFKIGVKEDAEYVGGLNLFGEHFGDYRQNIRMTARLER